MNNKFLFINSMSRTGTSLLYQLLYGHNEIYFPRYRIQFICSPPFGYPLLPCQNNTNPIGTLKSKTTVPINVSSTTRWSNIETRRISEIPEYDCNNFKLEKSYDLLKSVEYLHRNIENRDVPSDQYYCLHDDHSFILGSSAFLSGCDAKILTTIRSPLDMLASKKNMLVFHLYNISEPAHHVLKKEAIQKELLRSIFSWIVASYEYAHGEKYYPVLFEHIKGLKRRESMVEVSKFLGIKYDDCLEKDTTFVPSDETGNELLYAGSSLSFLTKGRVDTTIDNRNYSLTGSELEIANDFFNSNIIDDLIKMPTVKDFNCGFSNLWKKYETFAPVFPIIKDWFDMYLLNKRRELFNNYSSYNYGKINALTAFVS